MLPQHWISRQTAKVFIRKLWFKATSHLTLLYIRSQPRCWNLPLFIWYIALYMNGTAVFMRIHSLIQAFPLIMVDYHIPDLMLRLHTYNGFFMRIRPDLWSEPSGEIPATGCLPQQWPDHWRSPQPGWCTSLLYTTSSGLASHGQASPHPGTYTHKIYM